MLRNYFKTALRNLKRQKTYAAINIGGLTVAVTCCLLIYLFVQHERRIDTFHEYGERIHRIIRVMHSEDGARKVGITSAPFRDALVHDFPHLILEATRLVPSDGVVTFGEQRFVEDRFFIADANFFRVFSYPLVAGDPATVLTRPHTVVLSEATAQKYFGAENPIGRTIRVDGEQEYEVTGVFRQPAHARSHITFDLLASLESFREASFYTEWWWNMLHTYVLLPPEVEPAALQAQLPGFVDQYFGDDIARNDRRIELMLQPLNTIYFADDTTFDLQVRHGSMAVLYLFGVIALLIIGVACVNFVNLATARSVSRAREIGVRKALGARRSALVMQFLGEALLMTAAAGVLSFVAVQAVLPWFEQVIGDRLVLSLFSFEVVGVTAAFLLVTGIMAGVYPALFLSSLDPVRALKETMNYGTSQLVVRKGLIVFQFAISSLLVIGTLIVDRQLDYVATKALGFEPAQLLNIDINNGDIRARLDAFQAAIEQVPGVRSSSAMSGTPGGFFDNYLFRVGERWDETHTLKTLFADAGFTETLGLKLVAGRDFDPAFATDPARSVLINEVAAARFGWTPEEALGQRFENQYVDSTARVVVGVVENFHFESLHQPIAPLVVSMHPDRREILVDLDAAAAGETLAAIEAIWNDLSPVHPMEHVFLDRQFEQLYASDLRQRTVFSAFAIMAVFIAALGLFGLTAFNAEKRRTEMGIRKVCGATFWDLLTLLNREVIAVIGVSFLIALPIAYLLAEQWLQGYAYRVSHTPSYYVLAGALVLAVTVLTVSYHAVRAARMNPVDALRYE